MSTGQAVPNAQDAVTRAGVPKVEEWKKMAAEYKNSSISLGKLEAAAMTPQSSDSRSVDGGMNGGSSSIPPVSDLGLGARRGLANMSI